MRVCFELYLTKTNLPVGVLKKMAESLRKLSYTLLDLKSAIEETLPSNQSRSKPPPPPSARPTPWAFVKQQGPENSFDEVFPGLYLGDR